MSVGRFLSRGRRPAIFIGVGVTSTLVYGALAFFGSAVLAWPASVVSLIAYVMAGIFSYFGHRAFTFSISGDHGAAPLCFAALGAAGYSLAFGLPLFITDLLGYPMTVAIVVTSVVVPLINAFILSRFVFRTRLVDPPPRQEPRPGGLGRLAKARITP